VDNQRNMILAVILSAILFFSQANKSAQAGN